ncbi:NAD(P)H nitroreductase [soil metagenome]
MSPAGANLEFLLSRRSASGLGGPALTRNELESVLAATASVPDHGALRPFRFAIVEGEGRAAFCEALASAALEKRPDLHPAKLEGMRQKAFRSPTTIVLIASPKPGKVETWEQHATAACAGYAITLGAHAVGIGAMWKSVPFTRGEALARLLGLTPTEEMLGFIHLGRTSTDEVPSPRPPLDLAACTMMIDR